MDAQCPQCGSTRNISGFVGHPRKPPEAFAPNGLRFLTLRTTIEVQEAFRACFDCGHLWSKVSPTELESLVTEKGKEDAIRCMEG